MLSEKRKFDCIAVELVYSPQPRTWSLFIRTGKDRGVTVIHEMSKHQRRMFEDIAKEENRLKKYWKATNLNRARSARGSD